MATALTSPPAAPSRRGVLRLAGRALAAVPFAIAFVSLLRRAGAGRPPKEVRLRPEFRDGFAFAGDVVVRSNGSAPPTALSTRCTHLGCRISRVEDGLLVCPCHGSRFDAEGRPASGPATRALERLTLTEDAAAGELVVHVG